VTDDDDDNDNVYSMLNSPCSSSKTMPEVLLIFSCRYLSAFTLLFVDTGTCSKTAYGLLTKFVHSVVTLLETGNKGPTSRYAFVERNSKPKKRTWLATQNTRLRAVNKTSVKFIGCLM